MFSNFPEIILIDVCYQIDYWNHGLWIIAILDNNRNLRITAFGMIPVENELNNNWVLNEFA